MDKVWIFCFASHRYEATIVVNIEDRTEAEDIAKKFLESYLKDSNLTDADDMELQEFFNKIEFEEEFDMDLEDDDIPEQGECVMLDFGT